MKRKAVYRGLRLDMKEINSVADLAERLAMPVSDAALPSEDHCKSVPRRVLQGLKTAMRFLVTWSPVILVSLNLVIGLREYRYPVLHPKAIVLTGISLIPTLLAVVMRKPKKRTKTILLILCALCIPVSFVTSLCIASGSKTTDFHDYRNFDSQCVVNRNELFQAVFPKWPNYFVNEQQADGSYDTAYPDAHYLYQYIPGMDYTYDVYAQWPLEETAFLQEVERETEVFRAFAEDGHSLTVQKGNYTCFVIYTGAKPFEKAETNYTCCIFAYDVQHLKVRYIFCESLENGVDQPYYLLLDW